MIPRWSILSLWMLLLLVPIGAPQVANGSPRLPAVVNAVEVDDEELDRKVDEAIEEAQRQLEEQLEKLPEELREQVRAKISEQLEQQRDHIREEIRQKLLEKLAADAKQQGKEAENATDDTEEEQAADGPNGEPADDSDDEQQEKKKTHSDEAQQLKDEISLYEAQFKHRIAMYQKEIEEQRIRAEKNKIDRQLEAERIADRTTAMQREAEQLKLELEILKKRRELAEAEVDAKVSKLQSERELAEAELNIELSKLKAEKSRVEALLDAESAAEKLETRVLGEESYLEEPFQEGTLHVSLRRIELNGPIFSGAADYVCQRLDYFNNQSDKPIFLVIDASPGGSVLEGFQIVQAIERSKAPVHVVVKRFAASMAAVITTLADHSYCYPDAIILHHQASTGIGGNTRTLEDQLRFMKELSERLIGAVAEKIGLTEQAFVDQMYENRASGDWELFGDQAVERGWVGHVATCIREDGVRTQPRGTRPMSFIFLQDDEGQAPHHSASGYLERYEVVLPEQIDEKGQRYVKLPHLSPLDAWMIYNPDGYYR